MNIAHGYAKELLVVSVLLAWLASPNAAFAADAKFCLSFGSVENQLTVSNICDSEISVYVRFNDGSAYSSPSLGAGEEEIAKLTSSVVTYNYWACEGFDTLRRSSGGAFCEDGY